MQLCPFDTLKKLKADLVKAANEAWRATKLMDSFDKESDFKSRYDKNRQTLKELCESLGISTSTLVPTTTGDTNWGCLNWGCLIAIIIGVIILICCICN